VLATKFQLRGVREKAGSLSLFAEFFTLDKHSTTAVTVVAASAPFDFLFERLARRTRTGVPLSVTSEWRRPASRFLRSTSAFLFEQRSR
jgi:hypothetical protein